MTKNKIEKNCLKTVQNGLTQEYKNDIFLLRTQSFFMYCNELKPKLNKLNEYDIKILPNKLKEFMLEFRKINKNYDEIKDNINKIEKKFIENDKSIRNTRR